MAVLVANLAEDDAPEIGPAPLDEPDIGARKELGAVIDRVGEIGRVHSRLGAAVATAHAVAAHGAWRLHDTRGIGLLVEGDVQRHALDMMADRLARTLKRGELHRCDRHRQGFRRQHLARAVVAHIQAMIDTDFLGPSLVLEHHDIRRQAHGRIDQRCAAETAADERVDILADAQVEERIGRADMPAFAVDLHGGAGSEHGLGELAGQVLAPALQHRDLEADA